MALFKKMDGKAEVHVSKNILCNEQNTEARGKTPIPGTGFEPTNPVSKWPRHWPIAIYIISLQQLTVFHSNKTMAHANDFYAVHN